MDKNIDRLKIGVREWSIHSAIEFLGTGGQTGDLINTAGKFEEYVLRGIVSPNKEGEESD